MYPIVMKILALTAAPLVAVPAFAESRMVVDGHRLIYDLSESSRLPAEERTILPDDHLLLGEPLMENPIIDTIVVSGDGGLSWPAYEMAAKIEGFGLNTTAQHTCVSACTIILLGGRERTMQPGSQLGFHRSSSDADDLRDVYAQFKEAKGWKDEFAFAAHVFERGEIAARDYIDFLLWRGVNADFALRTLTYASMDMWYPSEAELLEAGVLTRRPKTAQEEAETP